MLASQQLRLCSALALILLCAPLGCVASLADLTATEALQLLCSREITAVAYNQALIDQITEHECLNHVATWYPDRVLQEAKAIDDRAARGEDVGPLCGLGFVSKDNIDFKGFPTIAGNPALEGVMPTNSSPVASKLLAANGILLAKIRMHELAWGGTSINPVYGPALNPYNVVMHTGGSSGGTGGIVAARGAPAGFCSDTGGSCRNPANMNGVVGFRPTGGCYNGGDGVVPLSTTRDTVGLIARTVTDVIFFDKIFSDCPKAYPAVNLKGLRFGYPTIWWTDLQADTIPVHDAAMENLKAAGAVIVPVDITDLLATNKVNYYQDLSMFYEIPRELSRYLYRHNYNISYMELLNKAASPLVKQKMLSAISHPLDEAGFTPMDYIHYMSVTRIETKRKYEELFVAAGVDVMLTPTGPITARPVYDVEPHTQFNGRVEEHAMAVSRIGFIDSGINFTSISVPVGMTENGLPVGEMLIAREGYDGVLLSIAEAFQAAMPELHAPPPPACKGCKAVVGVQEVTWDGKGPPKPGEVTSVYNMRFEGSCPLASKGLLTEHFPTGDPAHGTRTALAASILNGASKLEL